MSIATDEHPTRPPMTDEARDLAELNVRLAHFLAHKYHRRYRIDRDEAGSIALAALCDAAIAYVDNRESRFRFATYALNGILYAFATDLKRRSTRMRDWTREVSIEAGRGGFSLRDAIGQEDDPSEPEAESPARFEALLSVLPDREAVAMRAYYRDAHMARGSGVAARALGVSQGHAFKIHRRALYRLRLLANSPDLLASMPLIVRETLAR